MNVGSPHAAVMPALSGEVLAVLDRTSGGLTGREIQRLAKHGSVAGVWNALNRLVSAGVVTSDTHGRTIVYRANRHHLAWPAIHELLGLRGALFDLIADTAAALPGLLVATDFGSTARGDGGERSDIDLLLVRRPDAIEVEWDLGVEHLRAVVERATGNQLQVVDVSKRQWERMTADDDPLVRSIAEDGIALYPPSRSTQR